MDTASEEEASPELQSLRAQLDAAGAEIEKAKSGHKPTLDAVAQWSRSNSDIVTSVNSRYDNKVVELATRSVTPVWRWVCQLHSTTGRCDSGARA